MSKNELRVLTYNLHKGFDFSNRRFTLHQIRDALTETNADIMLLQEIQGEHNQHGLVHQHWPDEPHFEFLAKDIWPYYAYAKNAIYRIGHHGNAILSKYPIANSENINVSPFSWASRSLLHAEIKLPWRNDILHIICIHLGLLGIERRYQFLTLSDRIEKHVPHDAPLIVAGDFNDWTVQAEKRLSQHLNLREAYQTLHNRYARTWPSYLPVFKMDRIYYRGMEPTSCEWPRYISWKHLSDHAPLIASFDF